MDYPLAICDARTVTREQTRAFHVTNYAGSGANFDALAVLGGALGRLAIPGPNPMSIGMTILVGIGGALVGGFVGNLLFNRPGGLILAVAGAALIVWLIDRRGTRGREPRP